MSNNNQTMESTVETVDLDLNEIFDGAATAEGVTLPQEDLSKPKNNIFSKVRPDVDMSFADENQEDDATTEDTNEETVAKPKFTKEEGEDILNTFTDEEEEVDETPTKKEVLKGNVSHVFKTLIEKDKLIGFDDDRPLEEYTEKDWEELIEANLEEKARQIRNETPKQFFQSLPEELQIAARYVAEGGQDLKGLFQTLAQTEEVRSLDIKNERDQERSRENRHGTQRN